MAKIYGSNELLEDVRNKGLCIECGACADLCPYFKVHNGKTTMIFPCTSQKGRCYAFCPKSEVDLDVLSNHIFGKSYNGEPIGNYNNIHISRAGEKTGFGNFQNGGTVTSLLKFVFENGIIDAAALTSGKGLVPVPVLATDSEDIYKCASSKYVTSPSLSSVNKGIREGYKKIGVVGTPCQVTAACQMKINPLDLDDFVDSIALIIGLFCIWTLDTGMLLKFLSTKTDISQISGMDIPPPPANIMVVKTENKIMEIPLDEIREFVPDACSICPDMTSEFSDISVGAFEEDPSWNTLIIRTEKGREIVDKACKEGFLTIKTFPDQSLSHLRQGAGNKKKRAFAKAVTEDMINCTTEGKRSVLRMDAEKLKEITPSKLGNFK